MDFSLKKSLMSHGSYEHLKNIAGVASDHDGDDPEELPILSDQDSCDHHRHNSHRQPMSPVDSADRREVIVKINNGDSSTRRRSMDQSKVWRGSIYEFWREEEKERDNANDNNNSKDDFRFMQREQKTTADLPPSKLIGQFLHKQRASGDMSLDMDLEMNELRRDRSLPSLAKSSMTSGTSKELKVLFQPTALDVAESGSNESVRRRYKDSPDEDVRQSSQQSQDGRESTIYRRQNGSTGSDDEVLRCTSNAAFDREVSCQKKSTLLRMKTKSRLIDPPEDPDHRSGRVQKSGQVQKSSHVRSGIIGKGLEDDEDDPFWEEDLPDEFRKNNLSALTLIQWFSFILILGVFACTLSIPFLRHKNLWKLKLWKWEVLILVLICGRLVSGWGVRIVVFFIERNFLLRKRVLYFVYGVKNSVQNCLWLGLVLMAWHFLFDKKVQRETKSDNLKYVTKVLICFLVGTLVWLAKTLVVKVLASSFHVSKYFDRIQESLFNQYVIEVLSGAPLIEIKRTEEDEERLADDVRKLQNAGATIPPDLRAAAFQTARIGRVLGSGKLQRSSRKGNKFSQALGGKKADEGGITLDHLHKLNPKNVSAWNMKRLMNIVRHGSLTTLDEQILESTHDHEKAIEIRSEVEAKAAAKKIFQNVARPGAKHIYLHDLMRFMGDDEALKTMRLFEGASESRKISKASLKNWVVNAFRERRALSLTLNDTKFAVNKLHRMVNIIIGIVIVVIWLLILEIATRKFFLFVSSQLVLVAFIFGNTCKTVFESIVFLFVMHPFDVGDRCVIDGVEMVVEEMNILTTVFLRYDNTKLMYPNSVLSTKPINNYYRSPDMGDAVDFCIHMATPAEKIAAIRQRILNYVDNKKEHWYPSPMILMTDMEGLHTIKLAVWLTHRMNYQDLGERWVRRGLLVEEMTKIFLELDIQYRLNPLDINIRTMPPVTSSSRLPSNWTGTTS